VPDDDGRQSESFRRVSGWTRAVAKGINALRAGHGRLHCLHQRSTNRRIGNRSKTICTVMGLVKLAHERRWFPRAGKPGS